MLMLSRLRLVFVLEILSYCRILLIGDPIMRRFIFPLCHVLKMLGKVIYVLHNFSPWTKQPHLREIGDLVLSVAATIHLCFISAKPRFPRNVGQFPCKPSISMA
jgi:hypothetical protein